MSPSFREKVFGKSLLPLLSSEPSVLSDKKRKVRRRGRGIAHRATFVLLGVALVTIWGGFRASSSAPRDVYSSAEQGFQRNRGSSIAEPLLETRRASRFSSSRGETFQREDAHVKSTLVDSSRSLSFHVCNGFANQRLSIVYAAIVAKETGRSLRLPMLLLDGMQHDTSKQTTSLNSKATEFGTFYDVDAFIKGMGAAGVQVVDGVSGLSTRDSDAVLVPAQDLQKLLDDGAEAEAEGLFAASIATEGAGASSSTTTRRTTATATDPEEEAEATASSSKPYRDATHLHVECPLFKLDKSIVSRHRELVERVLSSLVPAAAQKSTIEQLKSQLSGISGHLSDSGHLGESGHNYNVLHLRVERDWIKHCRTWVSDARSICLAEEVVRAIGEHLDLKGVPRGTPLYVSCDVPAADPGLLDAAMKSLKAMGYKKITLQQAHGHGEEKNSPPLATSALSTPSRREIRAMHSYYLGMDSAKYIGNSVSTFSALLMLERQNLNRWSTYYNMGGVPLMDMLPFFRMPWVFTYNGESPGFDYMAKSAVLSAIHVGRVVPYCVYMGDKGDEMYQWFKKQGVHVVLHDPSWKVNIVQKYDEAKKFAKAAATYESISSLVATFMRFDIPIVHALKQYNYVLYTDIDVLFLKKIDLHSFPSKLPEAMTMAYEMDNRFPCNAGVVLYNLPYVRQSYHDLVHFAIHTPGLHFGDNYGPADQGALNQFYEDEMGSMCSLSEAFNAKPYKLGNLDSLDDVFILHFHGPKPKHYLDFANNRGCGPFSSAVGGGNFVSLCLEGLRNLCELRIDIPESMRFEGAWDDLNQLQSSVCKSRFEKLGLTL